MGNLWLKIRVWTKVAAFGFLLLYAIVFVSINYSSKAKVWLWFGHEPTAPVLVLVFVTFLLGVIGTILVRTTLKTVSQIRDLRTRTRTEKMERQMAAMHAKAGRLQQKAGPTAAAATPVTLDETEHVE
jgi:hypothetical protein